MTERYIRLYSLPENLYQINAPVMISAGALLKDNQTGNVLAQIRLKNICDKMIKAISIELILFDTAGRELEVKQKFQYLDLQLERNQMYGERVPIILDDNLARSYKVIVKEVVFSGNLVWVGEYNAWEDTVDFVRIEKKLNSELIKQYCIENALRSASFVPAPTHDLWVCVCGAINRNDEEVCHMCHKHLTLLQKSFDIDLLTEASKKRIAEEKVKAEAERIRIEEEKLKIKEEKAKFKDEKAKAKNIYSKLLKCLIPLQIILIMPAGFMSYNELIRILIILGTVLVIPCLILAIFSLKAAVNLTTKKGLKTGVLSLVFELLLIAFILWAVFS